MLLAVRLCACCNKLTVENRDAIATNGGIEAVANAMTKHANNQGVQDSAANAIASVVRDIPAHSAVANEAGVVPLLQHAATMGIPAATEQLARM